MRKFIQKALDKLGKMDREQIRSLIVRVSEENDLLGMLLESLTEGIIVTDREHRVMLYNKSAERLCPFATDDIVDKLLWDCLADRELADFFSSTLRSQGKAADREFTLDGNPPRILSVSLLPLVRGGSVEGSVAHIEDVTEKRSKEARLRRAESLASLTTLAAGVAHEIKNPLGSMGIHLQLIQKKIAGKECIDAKDIDQHLDVLNEEVDRLNRIVVDFLFAVKPMDTILEDGDVNHVIEELIQFVHPELDQAGVTIDARLSPALPLLRIDARYIKQALLNLIKNAVAAMPGGGMLSHRVPPLGRRGPRADFRHGRGHPRRDHGQDLRAVLHDEALRDRAGPHHRVQDRQGALRGHLGHLARRGGHDGHAGASRSPRRRRSSSTTRGTPCEAHDSGGRRREEHPRRACGKHSPWTATRWQPPRTAGKRWTR